MVCVLNMLLHSSNDKRIDFAGFFQVLQITVSSDVLAIDEDVRHGGLTSHLQQILLHFMTFGELIELQHHEA